MQVMRKNDLIRKNMVESVRNERNILAMANNPFVVSLPTMHVRQLSVQSNGNVCHTSHPGICLAMPCNTQFSKCKTVSKSAVRSAQLHATVQRSKIVAAYSCSDRVNDRLSTVL